jgi:hypothetical protein
LDNATDQSYAVSTSLSTVLHKTFHVRSQAANSLIDKCPQFVSKEKRQKMFGRVAGNKKSVQRQGHNFELKQYLNLTYCNYSQTAIWGVAPQGYHCACEYILMIILITHFRCAIKCLMSFFVKIEIFRYHAALLLALRYPTGDIGQVTHRSLPMSSPPKLRVSKVAVCCFSWGICYYFYGVRTAESIPQPYLLQLYANGHLGVAPQGYHCTREYILKSV